MTREVDLVSYLPPFMAGFQEFSAVLEAENPEFVLFWNAAKRVLSNQFIETADEYGIARFEKLLNIFPCAQDTLKSRRARVAARWFSAMPYTFRMLVEQLIALCGENNFTIKKHFDHYCIELDVTLELFGQVEELQKIIEQMLPCNMILVIKNRVLCTAQGEALTAGGICSAETFFITNDSRESILIKSPLCQGGGVVNAEFFTVTDTIKTE